MIIIDDGAGILKGSESFFFGNFKYPQVELQNLLSRNQKLHKKYQSERSRIREAFSLSSKSQNAANFHSQLLAISRDIKALLDLRTEIRNQLLSGKATVTESSLLSLDDIIYGKIEEGNFIFLKAPPSTFDYLRAFTFPVLKSSIIAASFFSFFEMFNHKSLPMCLAFTGTAFIANLVLELKSHFTPTLHHYFDLVAEKKALSTQRRLIERFEYLNPTDLKAAFLDPVQVRCRKLISSIAQSKTSL